MQLILVDIIRKFLHCRSFDLGWTFDPHVRAACEWQVWCDRGQLKD